MDDGTQRMAKKDKAKRAQPRAATLVKKLASVWRADAELRQQLARPASASRVSKAEKRLGLKLPRALVHVYTSHNGTGSEGIDGYYRLLSLDGVVKAKEGLDQLAAHDHFDDWRDGEWWNAAWLPFLEFEGDHLCVDTASGEILEFLAYNRSRTRLYASAYCWLSTLAELTTLARDTDDIAAFMDGRRAARLRKQLNPGYPVRRRARARPVPRTPKGLTVEHQSFKRGDYHWMIVRAGPFVRTFYGRAYSGRFSNKGFPDEKRAQSYVAKSIKSKRKGGYKPLGAMQSGADDVHGILQLAHRHMKSLKSK